MDKRGEKSAWQELDEKLDRALQDTFPGSDPIALTEPAPVREEDKVAGKARSRRRK